MDIEDIIHELIHLEVPEKQLKHKRKALKYLRRLIPEDRGQWITTDGSNLYCSKCKHLAMEAYDRCPNCNSEMHKDVELRFGLYNG